MAIDDEFCGATISLYGTVPDSIVDGPGLRYAVFVQGCSHHCPGCHNPESQPAEGGSETQLADLLADIEANGLVHAVTLSGGEPFEQAQACAALARALKKRGYNLWCYTGYLFEDLERRAAQASRSNAGVSSETGEGSLSPQTTGEVASNATLEVRTSEDDKETLANNQAVADLLDCLDVLVDGPFLEDRKSLGLKWCGSSNQRLIDVSASRRAGHVVPWQPASFSLEKPSNW